LEFLAEICKASLVPVYGIGGIDENNISEVAKTGAAGACLMSSLMRSDDPSVMVERLRIASELSAYTPPKRCTRTSERVGGYGNMA
jgi:thiamine monophosphate synthase